MGLDGLTAGIDQGRVVKSWSVPAVVLNRYKVVTRLGGCRFLVLRKKKAFELVLDFLLACFRMFPSRLTWNPTTC